MTRPYSFIKVATLSLLISSMALLMGCAVKAMPDNVSLGERCSNNVFFRRFIGPLNAEEDSSSYDIPTDKGQKLGFIGNRRV